jgi:hypothetical protein
MANIFSETSHPDNVMSPRREGLAISPAKFVQADMGGPEAPEEGLE